MQVCKNLFTHSTTQRTAAISLAILAVATLVIGIVSKVGFLHGLSTQGSMGMMIAGPLVLSMEALILGIKKWKNSKTTQSQQKFVSSGQIIKMRISQWTLQSPEEFKKACKLDEKVDAKERQLTLLRETFESTDPRISSSGVLLFQNTSHFTKTEWESVLPPSGWTILFSNETLIALNSHYFDFKRNGYPICGVINEYGFIDTWFNTVNTNEQKEPAVANLCVVKPRGSSKYFLFGSSYLSSEQEVSDKQKKQLVEGIKEIQARPLPIQATFLGINTAQNIPNLEFTNPNQDYYTLKIDENQAVADTIFYRGHDLEIEHIQDDFFLPPGSAPFSQNPSDHTPYILEATFSIFTEEV